MTQVPDTQYVTVNHTIFPVEGVAEVSALYVDTGTGDGSQPGEAYEIGDRRSITVYPHKRVSLSTYFNAFPASYWQGWPRVRDVRLVAVFRGTGLLSVYKPRGLTPYGTRQQPEFRGLL